MMKTWTSMTADEVDQKIDERMRQYRELWFMTLSLCPPGGVRDMAVRCEAMAYLRGVKDMLDVLGSYDFDVEETYKHYFSDVEPVSLLEQLNVRKNLRKGILVPDQAYNGGYIECALDLGAINIIEYKELRKEAGCQWY